MTITEADSNTLKVTSNAFKDGQYMPVGLYRFWQRHVTGFPASQSQ